MQHCADMPIFIFIICLLLSTVNASLIRGRAIVSCPEAQRCNIFAVTMHKILDNGNCVESCVMFPVLKAALHCGPCQNTRTTTKPAPLNAIPRISSPTSAPYEKIMSPSLRPTKAPSTVPVAVPTATAASSPNAPTTIYKGNLFSPTLPTTQRSESVPQPMTQDVTGAPSLAVTLFPTSAPLVRVVSSNVKSIHSHRSEYEIQLQLVDIPTSDQAMFTDAKEKWETVITGDVEDFTDTHLLSTSDFHNSGCEFPTTIDDIYICASYQRIDGHKNIVGLAGPTYNRPGDIQIPMVGEMEFDIEDIDFLKAKGVNGEESNFVHTILHEMGHVLGLGTNWNDVGIVMGDAETTGCPYTGSNANREYQAISGCDADSTVPTEQGSERGACRHWSEECMRDELMTGSLKLGSKPLLSRISVGSLEDLGYQVDYEMADQYTSANLAPECTCRRRRTLLDMLHGEALILGQSLRSGAKQPQRRRLSDESRATAVEYGRSILRQRSLSATDRKLALDTNAIYVGDQVVSVLIREGDEVYGVMVRRD